MASTSSLHLARAVQVYRDLSCAAATARTVLQLPATAAPGLARAVHTPPRTNGCCLPPVQPLRMTPPHMSWAGTTAPCSVRSCSSITTAVPSLASAPVTSSISLSQAQASLPSAATLQQAVASPYKHIRATGPAGNFRFYLPPHLYNDILKLQDKQTFHYAVVREDQPDTAMPVVQTVIKLTNDERCQVRTVRDTPNHITAGQWVAEGMKLTRVLWCSHQQLYVFVYSPAKEYLTCQSITHAQAVSQLEQVHSLTEPLVVPTASKGGAKMEVGFKFRLPKSVFTEVLGLKHGDPITWTAVRQGQVAAQPLMQARAVVSGHHHYLTAGRSGHVRVVGGWVHGEGLRLKQIRWSRQSGALMAVFVYA